MLVDYIFSNCPLRIARFLISLLRFISTWLMTRPFYISMAIWESDNIMLFLRPDHVSKILNGGTEPSSKAIWYSGKPVQLFESQTCCLVLVGELRRAILTFTALTWVASWQTPGRRFITTVERGSYFPHLPPYYHHHNFFELRDVLHRRPL
jgi:hypothetical protein